MKQKVYVPSYFSQFSCIASKCEETCCAGWYIAIDEVSYKKYKKVKHPEMRKRLDKEIVARKGSVSKDCVAKIKLKNNRCAFLAKDNLCDIYKHLGENYLSETCRVYPRNINAVGERLELSLALSCPQAARIILNSSDKITFSEEEDRYHLPVVGGRLNLSNGKMRHFEDGIIGIREQLISILQNRSKSFEERWLEVECAMQMLNTIQKKQDMKMLQDFILNGPKKQKQIADQATLLQEERLRVLWQALGEMRNEKKWSSSRYETCFLQMQQGLSIGQEEGQTWSSEKYGQGMQKLKKALDEKWQLLFENYFVSYLYERLVPLDQASVMESYKQMATYFEILSLHLIGMLNALDEVTDEEVITLIQSFTRVFDHNEQLMEQLKKHCLKYNTKQK